MHGLRLLRRAGIIAGAGAFAAIAGVIPAQAATVPGWRIVKTIGPAAGVTYMQSILATGSRDAWATVSSCPASCTGTADFLIEHWNGATWQQTLPAKQQAAENAEGVALGASSASNAWLFNGYSGNGHALHWNGRAWSARSVPSWVVRGNLSGSYDVTASAFAADNVWVFSLGQDSFSTTAKYYAARYNGHRWLKVGLPAIPGQVSVVSASDIWVLGRSVKHPSTSVLMHWNGRTWGTLAAPKTPVPAGSTASLTDPLGVGPRDVWVQEDITKGTAGSVPRTLLNWTGKSWRAVSVPPKTTEAFGLTPDGHGGFWMIGSGPAPSYRWYFYHRSGGHWTSSLAPARSSAKVQQLQGIARVPGTRSMWAVGQLLPPGEGGNGIVGTIWRYTS